MEIIAIYVSVRVVLVRDEDILITGRWIKDLARGWKIFHFNAAKLDFFAKAVARGDAVRLGLILKLYQFPPPIKPERFSHWWKTPKSNIVGILCDLVIFSQAMS